MNKTNASFIDLDLNKNRFTEQLLLPLETGFPPLLHDREVGVPGMDGIRFMFRESGDAALFHIAKRDLKLITGAVVWGQNDTLLHWLVDYRAAQLPWVPGSGWDIPEVSQLPLSAFMYHLGISTLPAGERNRVQEFRKHLVAAIILA